MLMNSNEYLATIEQVKQEIKAAQYKAAVHVNTELIMLYHGIGCVINAHKSWGNKFIENLAQDIKLEFPPDYGLFRPKPEIYGEVCTTVSRCGICASVACTNHLVSQYCFNG